MISERYGQLITDIIGPDGLKKAAGKTKISQAYLNRMAAGHVAQDQINAKFVAGYDLDPATTKDLMDAAAEVRDDSDMERVIQAACDGAGLSVGDRLRILRLFRELRGKESHQSA